jgi:hypothetical protein
MALVSHSTRANFQSCELRSTDPSRVPASLVDTAFSYPSIGTGRPLAKSVIGVKKAQDVPCFAPLVGKIGRTVRADRTTVPDAAPRSARSTSREANAPSRVNAVYDLTETDNLGSRRESLRGRHTRPGRHSPFPAPIRSVVTHCCGLPNR